MLISKFFLMEASQSRGLYQGKWLEHLDLTTDAGFQAEDKAA